MSQHKADLTTSLIFRHAITTDAAALSELAITTFYEAFASFNTDEDMQLYSSKAFSVQQVEKELADEHALFILVYQAEALIGYARLRTSHTPEALQGKRAVEIERFYIREAHIGKQIGGHLMKECTTHAIQHLYNVIWLGVWEHNHRALGFYKKWGFTQFGSHPFLLGKDLQTDLLMKKDLA